MAVSTRPLFCSQTTILFPLPVLLSLIVICSLSSFVVMAMSIFRCPFSLLLFCDKSFASTASTAESITQIY